jgi:hypothetical protein
MTKIVNSVWECVFWCICIASISPNRKYKSIADMNKLGGNNKKLINNIWIKKEVFGKI